MKIKRLFALVALMIFCSQTMLFAQSSGKGNEKPAEILSALEYLSHNTGRWTTVAINASGSVPDADYAKGVRQEVEGNFKQGYQKVTDIARDVLAVAACGYNPDNLGGRDLISELTGFDAVLGQGANGPIYSLLALDSRGFSVADDMPWTREKLCQAILTFQDNNGGFSLNESLEADVDVTAAAVTALSPYTEKAEIAASVDQALTWLQTQQNEDGTFSSLGVSSSESTASVMIALIALGIPMESERFSRQGMTPYDALLTFQNSDGSFSHVEQGSGNIIATEQAVMALSAVFFGKSPYRLATLTPPPETARISLTFVFMTVGFVILIYLILLLVRKIGQRFSPMPRPQEEMEYKPDTLSVDDSDA